VRLPGRVGLLALVAVAVSFLAASSEAYEVKRGTYRWPHPPLPPMLAILDFSRITYFDASEFTWSVDRAADAWNRARVGYELVPVGGPFGAAVIFTGRQSARRDCSAHAKQGFPPWKTFQRDFPRRVALSGRCDRYLMVLVAAHEFGHVLGLDHENGTCALMNSTQGTGGRLSTPSACPGFPRRQWWRNPVRLDDIRGVKELYYSDAHDPGAPLDTPGTG
jgi:Matrixin